LLAEMANQEHMDILSKGVKVWNEWRTVDTYRQPDLRDANLSGEDLGGANLFRTNLIGASLRGGNLSGANLFRADLIGANLSGANLGGADLIGANLRGANLIGANLTGTDLRSTDLNGANLNGADLDKARFEGTNVINVDLSTVRGLDSIQHRGPSSIGIDTIFLSKGKIPESFLRGCGVPENFITYMRSLAGEASDFYSCFISYSTKDQDFAERLHADLQTRGVRCWFAPHDIQGGKKVHEQIGEAIHMYDKLLLILSDASIISSWVKTEIANARAKEVQRGGQMLFPISVVPFDRIKAWKLFDADTGVDSAREIREYFVPDFSNWKDHDSYARAFDRLVRDLKAEPSDKAEAQPAG
jgi:hypothetical protein